MRSTSWGVLFALVSTLPWALSCGKAEPGEPKPRDTATAQQASALESTEEAVSWTVKDWGTPARRYDHAIAYDAARGKVVLFGGSAEGFIRDTWVWDGTRWDNVTPASEDDSPPDRRGHALAYDSVREKVVLFGGDLLADTWEWDGEKWTEVTPENPEESPPGRRDHALAYDSDRGKVVLFGGWWGNRYRNDTWEWDGEKWTEVTPEDPDESPPARGHHALAYDPARERVVLFGGSGQRNDVWEWDGTKWIEIFPEELPPGRSGHALTYDSAREKVMLFGGNTTDEGTIFNLNDVWEWDGENWNELTPAASQASPSRRMDHALAYDSARGKMVLFGGHDSDYLNDTWEWDETTGWVHVEPGIPEARYGHGLAYDAKQGKTVLFGGSGDDDYLDDTWEWDGVRWTEVTPALSPSRRFWPGLAYDAAREKLVLFGGSNWMTRLNDTWEWDGVAKTWNDVTPSDPDESPPPRFYPAIAYDSAREQVVLFGGEGEEGYLADTWVWDGARWVDVTPDDPLESPPPRRAHMLAYDSNRERVVLFGGRGSSGWLDDTWEWDGTSWENLTPIAPAPNPAARQEASLVYAGAGKVLLYGGDDEGETWEWDGTSWTLVTSTSLPGPRDGATLAFDSARRRVVLFGGYYDRMFRDETWELGVLGGCVLDAECEVGVCVGGVCQDLCADVLCEPPDACHEGVCDPLTGQCSYTPIVDSGVCGDEADAGDEADSGDDIDACADGECEPPADDVCQHEDDGAPCGEGDECSFGLCRTGVCEQVHRLDGTLCEGGVCIAGICRLDREPVGADEGGSGAGDDGAGDGAGSRAESDGSEEGGGLCSVSARSSTPAPVVTAFGLLAALGMLRRARPRAPER